MLSLGDIHVNRHSTPEYSGHYLASQQDMMCCLIQELCYMSEQLGTCYALWLLSSPI